MKPEDSVDENRWRERKMAVKNRPSLDETFAYQKEEHTYLDEVQFVVDEHSDREN